MIDLSNPDSLPASFQNPQILERLGLAAHELVSGSASAVGFNASSKYSYRTLMANQHNLSFSMLEKFELCPRRYELDKLLSTIEPPGIEHNVDFVFGHAVAAGVQHYLAFGDVAAARKALVFAWNAELTCEDSTKGKSIWHALHALDRFLIVAPTMFADWEVAVISGKPAIELSFVIHLQNNYKYYGHVDLILRHKTTGEFLVFELKTTGFASVDATPYKHSFQALSYTIILDHIAENLGQAANFSVLYMVYKSKDYEFVPLPFYKTPTHRANWIQTLMLQCEELDRYEQTGCYPKRKTGCKSYMKQCPHFDVCDGSNNSLSAFASLSQIDYPSEEIPEEFHFSLRELIQTQHDLLNLA